MSAPVGRIILERVDVGQEVIARNPLAYLVGPVMRVVAAGTAGRVIGFDRDGRALTIFDGHLSTLYIPNTVPCISHALAAVQH